MRPTPDRIAVPLLGLALALALSLAARAAEDDFKPLVKGDDPEQFELVAIDAKTITIKDGEVRLTGKPNGYFATKDSYKDFVVRFDFKYDRPEGLESDDRFTGNSGLLLNIAGPHKVWPTSIEFQLMNKEVGKMIPVSGAKCSGKWDAAAYKRAIKPVGEWNSEEVVSKGGMMTCKLNGVEVASGRATSPERGPMGWQSEGAPIRFRNLMIKALD